MSVARIVTLIGLSVAGVVTLTGVSRVVFTGDLLGSSHLWVYDAGVVAVVVMVVTHASTFVAKIITLTCVSVARVVTVVAADRGVLRPCITPFSKKYSCFIFF